MSDPTIPDVPVNVAAAQAVAGDQLAQAAAQPIPTDAGPTLEQIQQAQRAAILPYEQTLASAMEQIKQLQSQLADVQSNVTLARQAAGPPAVEQYANGVAALVKAHAAANPDLGPEAFAGVIKAAGELQSAATEAVSSRDVTKLNELRAEVETWVSHFRGKHLDFSSLRADLELLAGAAIKLAGV